MLICLQSHAKSIDLLSKDTETRIMIGAIASAYSNNAEKQLAGVFSSLQLPLIRSIRKKYFGSYQVIRMTMIMLIWT